MIGIILHGVIIIHFILGVVERVEWTTVSLRYSILRNTHAGHIAPGFTNDGNDAPPPSTLIAFRFIGTALCRQLHIKQK